ncbi:hypothetical protein NAEX_09588 [Nannocystis exedens]|nr:hypothetical protein NAEX_09588 [Nannocystis exedens]
MLLDFLAPPVCLACRHLLRTPPPGGVPPLCSRCAPELAPLDPAARRVGDVEACFLYEGGNSPWLKFMGPRRRLTA